MELFGSHPPTEPKRGVPLAQRMRPTSMEEFVGQQHLLGTRKLFRGMLDTGQLQSVILWGPPGCGKTTLARLLATACGAHCIPFSAVRSGTTELKKLLPEAQRLQRLSIQVVVLVDEIHHFNKTQQDTFLPYIEEGLLTLIGATTENPSFELIAPLLSRAQVCILQPLSDSEVRNIIHRALKDQQQGLGKLELGISTDAEEALIGQAAGDARVALNALEAAAALTTSLNTDGRIELELVQQALQKPLASHDKSGDAHYQVTSAFIKSLRGSDPDAAVYWLVRMLEAGEDPLFIARRMVIFAAEDIGNADPLAIQVVVAAKEAFQFVGLPEGRIPLAQATTYLATAPKSNASYLALLRATEDVREKGSLPVPMHLRNAPTQLMKDLSYGKGYIYPHDFPDQHVEQNYLPSGLEQRRYYEPTDSGHEAIIKERLSKHSSKC
jgi:putative ATPase